MAIKKIGRYEVRKLIGQGGMATVYLGFDPRSHREVAIKVLPPYYIHASKYRQRFEREARTIALLEHPAIVPVYDVGEDDGQPYIVMRYMSGGSLSDRLQNGQIPIAETVDMITRLAPALDAAHARGVIHRDLKPDNILFDQYGTVFLSDFGLARLRESVGLSSISDGSVLGTPAYMSPEQIQGKGELDGRSDIYSLGVVLYHMLAGSAPFAGSTSASVMMMHLINPVPHVYERNNALPTGIQVVLETAMSKNPDDRFQTATALAKALEDAAIGYKVPEPGKGATAEGEKDGSKTLIFGDSETGVRPPKTDSLPRERKASPLRIREWLIGIAAFIVLALAILLIPRWLPQLGLGGVSAGTTTSPSAITGPVIGGADQLAFLRSGEIWSVQVDGSKLTRLTYGGGEKSNPQWLPDGQAVLFTAGECIQIASMGGRQLETVACLDGISSFDFFELSPDGSLAAVGLQGHDLYIIDFDLTRLRTLTTVEGLKIMSSCQAFSPYQNPDSLDDAQWSKDSKLLALHSTQVGAARDVIRFVDIEDCASTPTFVSQLPSSFFLFTISGYYANPEIPSFSWNGSDQLLLNSARRENDFGNLQLIDLVSLESRAVTPVRGSCCYRDAVFSPDGSYVLFAFQESDGQPVQLYYLPVNDLRTSTTSSPVALPIEFSGDGQLPLQPVLHRIP